jgi:hypothetical protein
MTERFFATGTCSSGRSVGQPQLDGVSLLDPLAAIDRWRFCRPIAAGLLRWTIAWVREIVISCGE